MIKVAITDDHPVTRKGVESVLDAELDIEVTGKTSSGNELMTHLRDDMPDIAILDISMPDESGLDLLKDLKKQFPELPVIILSLHPPKRYAVRCLKDGASSYLNKLSETDELIKAIRHIVNRERRYLTKSVSRLLAETIDISGDGALHEKLSDREFTVLCMIAEGENVKSIGNKLSLSPHTIQTYRSRIKDKMQLNSDVEMARYAIKYDLI